MQAFYHNSWRRGQTLTETQIEGFPCLIAPAFAQSGLVEHLFTTRAGGVSSGIYESCNFSFARGDDPQKVAENYRRVAKALHCAPEDIVATRQTHTTNILAVTKKDGGKGVTTPADYEDIDGLMTDAPGVALGVFTADCVPILFLDPRRRAIGAVHSGWRGTAGEIGVRLLEKMEDAYGCQREDFLVAIGPSICRECYEVSADVAETFTKLFCDCGGYLQELSESGLYAEPGDLSGQGCVTAGKAEGKYQLDLWLANMLLLRRAGIAFSRMTVTDLCTCHNPKRLFSHRASQGKRGNLGAFIRLKE